jgi:hypothetical protein
MLQLEISTMQITLDHIAISGYSLLIGYSLLKFSDTYKTQIDLAANILIMLGLGSLVAYHYRKIKTKKDENTDTTQKGIRVLAHSCITIFLLITLHSSSKSMFQMYDTLALIAHGYLTFAVSMGTSQLPAVGLLALYFAFATFQKGLMGKDLGLEVLTLVGRFLLLFFFSVSFIKGATHMN